jgi:hypothetical protein
MVSMAFRKNIYAHYPGRKLPDGYNVLQRPFVINNICPQNKTIYFLINGKDYDRTNSQI